MMLHAPLEALPNEAARVRLAARSTTPEATLAQLAADPALTVRAAVALNPAFAPLADARLLEDQDDRVRTLLASRMARLLPGLSQPEQAAAQAHVEAVLMTLAQDAASRVRSAISDVLATMPEAPRSLILTLARDPVLAVSDPVVRLSPQLSDEDLLELLATPPHPMTAISVARRRGLSEAVADDIAHHADSAAVQALLSNTSATIREATLDALVGRAGDHPEWHEPLVCRPTLPLRAIFSLSMVVTGRLLAALTARDEVTPALAESIRTGVAETLSPPPPPTEAELIEEARRMAAAGQVTEAVLMDIVAAGDARRAAALLGVCGQIELATIDRAVGLRSAKAIVSLVARAGFGMETAVAIQGLLGRLAPGETLRPTPEGAFPLTQDEMDWQIELLGQPGR